MSMKHQALELSQSKRIVIKVGSSLLVDDEHGTIHREWLAALAEDVAQLRARGQEVLIVSSGAIAVGRRHLKFSYGNLRLEEKQAAAATGMLRLAHAYQEELALYNLTMAQVLMTLDDSENRRRYLNARNTLEVLLRLGVVPLINENDTVATDEIRLGDNDRLGARVAAMVSADTLVLLSDVDGLYTSDPSKDNSATIIPVVHEITLEIEAMAGQAQSQVGTGGMVTKLIAAKVAVGAGCSMVIANGLHNNPITKIIEQNECTWFSPKVSKLDARKKWIISSIAPKGEIIIDDGAKKALRSGKSLLAAGIKKISGKFNKGDHIKILDKKNVECARGLSSFTSDEIIKIMGHHSNQIEKLLGYVSKSEVIHKDDMVEV